MGELHSTLLAELQSVAPDVYILVTIVGGEETYRWTHAKHGSVSSLTDGLYEGRIVSAGKVHQVLPKAEGSLTVPTLKLTVDDMDLAITKVLYDIDYRRAVTVQIAAQGVDAANYYPVFSGVVEGVSQKAAGRYEISCRFDDSWLDRKLPQSRLTIDEHSALQPDLEGLGIPILVGIERRAATGVYPGYFVGGANNRFLFAGHRCDNGVGGTPAFGDGLSEVLVKNADNDWTDAKAGSATWTYGETIISGQTYAYVELNTTAPSGWTGSYLGESPEVMFSLWAGHHDKGGIWETGAGAVDNSPDTAWTYILDYFAWRNWRQGVWADAGPGAAPIAATPTGTYKRPYDLIVGYPEMAGWLGGKNRTSVRKFLQEFCDSFAFYPHLDWTGTLQALWWDHLVASVYPSATIDWDAPGVRDMHLVRGADDSAGRILAVCDPIVMLDGTHKWQQSFLVEEADSPALKERKVHYPWHISFELVRSNNRQVRHSASQVINRFRRRMPDLTCALPLWYLDYKIGQDFGVADPRGPNLDGTAGWSKENDWSRRMYRLTEMHVDLDKLEMSARLEDSQSAQATLWATFLTKRSTTADAQEGVCEIGVTFEDNRVAANGATDLWVDDPSTGTCHRLGAASLPLDAANRVMYPDAVETQGGVMVQREQGQEMSGSLFDSANWGSWTAYGSAVYTRNTDARFYDLDATLDGYAVVTAPDPVSAEAGIQQTTVGIGPILIYGAVAITYRSVSGDGLTWRLERSGGGDNTWDDTAKAWGVGKVNLLPMVHGRINRFRSNGMPITGSGATYTLYIYFATGSTASSQVALYEGGLTTPLPWAGSRIKAAGGAATRTAQTLKYRANNNNGDQIWPDFGSLEVDVMPQWNSLDLPRVAGALDIHAILDLVYDADNRWLLFYYATGGSVYIQFNIKAAGAAVGANAIIELVRGRSYKIRALWTATGGELGLANYSRQVSVEGAGAKVTSAVIVSAATPTYVTSQYLWVGSYSTGVSQWDGWIRNLRIKPYVEAV